MSTSSVIRIRLKAYDSRLLDASAGSIVSRVLKTGASVKGPVPLPVSVYRVTVNRSPHVFKKSREHFEIRTYRRLIYLSHSNAQTVESLTRLELPAGVHVEVKLKEE